MKENFKFLQGHPKTLCCFCKEELTDGGNNPDPVVVDNPTDKCCDGCNWNVVIPTRYMVHRGWERPTGSTIKTT